MPNRTSRLPRSEEHTSELQSHSDLVCRLLLVARPPTSTRFPYTTLFRSGGKEPKRDANKPKPLAEADIVLKRVGPQDIHIRTFRSTIDGSVQSYAVHSATADAKSNKSAPEIGRAHV